MQNCQEIIEFYLNKESSFFDSLIAKETVAGVPHSEYLRIPVYSGKCIVLLMIWGVDAGTAIHGHGGIEGTVKVIKGVVKEEKYEFTGTGVELISSRIHTPGDVLSEDTGTIHSIINRQETFSVTLHIYNTDKNTLAGTVMYEPETRRIGILNDQAKSTSWKEDPMAFKCIIPFEQSDGILPGVL
jgi:predicted metal-dependent enzyme (double-stranded beta helix superfamily)